MLTRYRVKACHPAAAWPTSPRYSPRPLALPCVPLAPPVPFFQPQPCPQNQHYSTTALHKNERRRASGASVPHSTWSAALRDCRIGILANCIICRDFSKGCHRAMNMGDTRGAKLHNANLPQGGSTEFLCKATPLLFFCSTAPLLLYCSNLSRPLVSFINTSG